MRPFCLLVEVVVTREYLDFRFRFRFRFRCSTSGVLSRRWNNNSRVGEDTRSWLMRRMRILGRWRREDADADADGFHGWVCEDEYERITGMMMRAFPVECKLSM
jgi:hypothetical protein